MINYRVGHPGNDSNNSVMDGGADISEGKNGEIFNGAWSHLTTEPFETNVEDFCLVVNGNRVFIEGFDWQPLESNLSNVLLSKQKECLESRRGGLLVEFNHCAGGEG